MQVVPWDIVVQKLNALEPNRKNPYTEVLCWQIACRAFRKLRTRYPRLVDSLMADLRDPSPTLPVANVLFKTSSHRLFNMAGFDPTYASTEDDFTEVDFTETADIAPAPKAAPEDFEDQDEPEEPEPGPTLPTEYRAALAKSCAYWRKKLARPIVEEQE